MSSRLTVTQIAFGLVAWLEETKIALPLKGVECRFDVTAGVASVEIDQIFHQSHRTPLDCTYTFPLPAEAAVFRCEMHINGKVIAARVEEKREARRIFAEQKAAGRRASLVEVERENLFTLSLGNVQPDDVIVIRFAYFQTLERAADSASLRVPVCPGIRYIPGKPLLRSLSGKGTADDTDQVPDASRISPPRIDALHPDAAYFYAEGKISRSDAVADTVSSPTHAMLAHPDEGVVHLALAQHGGVPDRDFVLRWQEPKEATLAPRGWMSSFKDGQRHALVQLRAPIEVAVATDVAHDYYFLVDRSGSMQGAKWTKTCEALTAFVKLLGTRDRVWITLFESAWSDYAELPTLASDVLRDKGFRDLVKLGTGGGTELRPAAEHVMEIIQANSEPGAATVVIITDGEVGNERELLTLFRKQPSLQTHTFGIDTTVNDASLKALARQQKGGCWLQTPNDDIAGTIAKLADRLRRPVITNLEVGGAWKPAASGIPSLHAGETLEISLALPAKKEAPLEISGVLASGARHAFPLSLMPSDNPAIALLWARERIATLLADGKSTAAIALAKKHNILCEGAAFIAWDESEKVDVAQHEIYQPSQAPHAPMAPCQAAPCIAAETDLDALLGGALFGARPSRPAKSTPPSGPLTRELGKFYSGSESGLKARRKVTVKSLRDQLVEAGVDDKVAEILETWAKARFFGKSTRQDLLKDLITSLNTPGIIPAARVALCREFVKLHLAKEATLQPVLLDLIAKWESAAGV